MRANDGTKKTQGAHGGIQGQGQAVRGVKTISEIAQAFGVHPVMVGQWKKEILEQTKVLFETKRGPKPIDIHEAQLVEVFEYVQSRERTIWIVASQLVDIHFIRSQ